MVADVTTWLKREVFSHNSNDNAFLVSRFGLLSVGLLDCYVCVNMRSFDSVIDHEVIE
jgi:hypothetical protein